MAVQQLDPIAPQYRTATPAWGRWIVSLSDRLDRVSTFGFVIGTGLFATVMLCGVFFRYVLNNSLSWSDEVALMIFAWAIFLSIACGYLHDKHVSTDLLVHSLPAKWAALVRGLAEALSGGYLLSLTVAGIGAIATASTMRSDALHLPLTVPYLAIPTACVIMDIHWVRRNVACGTPLSASAKLLVAVAFFVLVYLPFGHYVPLTGTLRAVLILLMLFGPLLIGVPVALSLGLVSTFYLGIFADVPFETGALQVFNGVNMIALMAIPLLILSGKLMHNAGIAKLIVDFAQVLVGRIRGGLGAANIVASFIFGDISGSAVSDTAAIGSLMIPQMKARGYRPDFCAALQGAAGTLGMLAPLAITLLLYATAVNASVSRLAAATILPALLVASSFALVTLVHARRHNYPRECVPRGELLPRTLKAMPGMLALVVVIGGVLGGIFTPSEVGSVLAFYVLILSTFLYDAAHPRRLFAVAVEAGYISGMTLFMASTSTFLGFVLARDMVSTQIVDLISQFTMDKLAIIFVVSIIFIILGMILEPPAMIFGFLPSFMPLLMKADVDIVHWGMLFAVNLGLGCIIPPVAMNLFVSTQLAGVRYEQVVKAAVPFMIIMMVDIVIMAVFPQIPLALPHIIFDYPIK